MIMPALCAYTGTESAAELATPAFDVDSPAVYVN